LNRLPLRLAALLIAAVLAGCSPVHVKTPEDRIQPRKFLWPVSGPVSSGFGNRSLGRHEGIDILAPLGTPVGASERGIVSYAGNGMRGYGNAVILDHGDGIRTLYGPGYDPRKDGRCRAFERTHRDRRQNRERDDGPPPFRTANRRGSGGPRRVPGRKESSLIPSTPGFSPPKRTGCMNWLKNPAIYSDIEIEVDERHIGDPMTGENPYLRNMDWNTI